MCATPSTSIADDAVKIIIAADRELGVLDQRTGIYETLVPVKSRPTSVAYDLEKNMYFWVDEFLNVFVLGKPNSVPLYPGIFLDIKSPSFFNLLKHGMRSIYVHVDIFGDSFVINHEST
mgnify:CR=1 FL=1